jgi:hypothetical protein
MLCIDVITTAGMSIRRMMARRPFRRRSYSFWLKGRGAFSPLWKRKKSGREVAASRDFGVFLSMWRLQCGCPGIGGLDLTNARTQHPGVQGIYNRTCRVLVPD